MPNKKKFKRKNDRSLDSLREISFVRDYTKYAEGSVLVSYGETKVLCNVSLENSVPSWLKSRGTGGWVTAEYSMLPRATSERTKREVSLGRPSGRTLEIQRLIGRSLRSVVDLKTLGEKTFNIDCDVLQADGGTRTAAISGSYLALSDACDKITKSSHSILSEQVAAVSLGVFQNQILLDLDYDEDYSCDADINIVMNSNKSIIEIQGTAEKKPFSEKLLIDALKGAKKGLDIIFFLQKKMIEKRKLKSITSESYK